MKITIITPAGAHSRSGNRYTARRWARLLTQLGHRVNIQVAWGGQATDLLIALHARKSHPSIRRCHEQLPDVPIILALTGTDLYRDIQENADARESLQLADRMIVLQEDGLRMLPEALRTKTRVIYQSAQFTTDGGNRPFRRRYFDVCVIGHLREEKDPFCCYRALRWLPDHSRIRVTHLGGALCAEMADEAKAYMAQEARYRWLGNRPHGQTMRRLANSQLMVISSYMEGGATVVSEALAAGVPVLASDISGNIGMLGEDYSGYFPAGDDAALARLLYQAETAPGFYRQLKEQCAKRQPLIQVERERACLETLLEECQRIGNRHGRFSSEAAAAPLPDAGMRRRA